MINDEILRYYQQPAMITDLTKYKSVTEWIVPDPNVISQVVQGLIVHDCWFKNYQLPYDETHEYSQKTAYMQDLLDKALELDPTSLVVPRHPKDRVIACCRELATLMCAILRVKGIPARSRCGFALYFGWDGNYEDHWICEFWNGSRWVRWDPQIDPLQQCFITQWGKEGDHYEEYKERIHNFNPHDLTLDDFITAGEAWVRCRQHKIDPMKFGIASTIRPEWGITTLHGLWFVRGQLLRDFAALNKVETVPYLVRISQGLSWKSWHLVGAEDDDLTTKDFELLDEIAKLSCHPDDNLEEIQRLYQHNAELRVPDDIIQR